MNTDRSSSSSSTAAASSSSYGPPGALQPVRGPSAWKAGDFDHDGHVTASDYNVWRASFGSTTQLDADGNGDHIVDAADYVLWRQQLSIVNGQAAISSRSMNVPEPLSTFIGLQITALLWGYSRPRRSTKE